MHVTINENEYEALGVGLDLAWSLGGEILEAKYDSLLVLNQINRTFEVQYEVKYVWRRKYMDKVHI